MKTIFIALFLFLFINSHAQVNPFVGAYFLEGNAVNAKIAYSLSLEADGTFLMHFYRKLVAIPVLKKTGTGVENGIQKKTSSPSFKINKRKRIP